MTSLDRDLQGLTVGRIAVDAVSSVLSLAKRFSLTRYWFLWTFCVDKNPLEWRHAQVSIRVRNGL